MDVRTINPGLFEVKVRRQNSDKFETLLKLLTEISTDSKDIAESNDNSTGEPDVVHYHHPDHVFCRKCAMAYVNQCENLRAFDQNLSSETSKGKSAEKAHATPAAELPPEGSRPYNDPPKRRVGGRGQPQKPAAGTAYEAQDDGRVASTGDIGDPFNPEAALSQAFGTGEVSHSPRGYGSPTRQLPGPPSPKLPRKRSPPRPVPFPHPYNPPRPAPQPDRPWGHVQRRARAEEISERDRRSLFLTGGHWGPPGDEFTSAWLRPGSHSSRESLHA
ncbi:hypothetical protein F4780DRAFT_784162 [Xylariomycetidae sp. FL0641]|nr:hypothetical protein F4780DRAFT_784162 [Xylariomycetidae sp. FL0641]